MATSTLSVSEEVLNARPPKKKLVALWGVQGSIFSFFYGAVELVLATALQVILFPAATVISIYNTYRNIRNYSHDKNKSFGKKVSLAVNILGTLAEMAAVTGAVAAYSQMTWGVGFEFLPQLAMMVGLQLTTFMAVPAIFLGILGVNCLSHLAKTVVHGIKMAHTAYKYGTYTAKFAHHKDEFLLNLRLATVFGVSATAIGLLLLTPAFHLATLSAGAIIAVKAVASFVAEANALWTFRGVYKRRQADKKVAEQKADEPVLAAPKKEIIVDFGNDAENARVLYKQPGAFMSLDEHVDDLKRRLDAVSEWKDGPQKVMLSFLTEEADKLQKHLGVNPSNPSNAPRLRNNDQEEREVEITKETMPGKYHGMDPQAPARRDKLQALQWIKTLVTEGKVKVPELDKDGKIKTEKKGDKRVVVEKELDNVEKLMDYIKNETKKEKNVMGSFLNNYGGMQKIFALAGQYVGNAKYDPKNQDRKNFFRMPDEQLQKRRVLSL